MPPRKENSSGLVDMTLEGRTSPHKKERPSPEKSRGRKFFPLPKLFVSPEKIAGFFFAQSLAIIGKSANKSVKAKNAIFFRKLPPSFKKKKTEKSIRKILSILCRIFPGFFIFITIFFAREKMLFKIQYMTRPLGELYRRKRKISAIP